MSKAEERALEAYPPKLATYGDLFGETTLDDNGLKRAIFIEGYHQAEKDLKPTVKEADLEEDVEKILEEYDWNYDKIDFDDFAKHFFELGLKAQKGE